MTGKRRGGKEASQTAQERKSPRTHKKLELRELRNQRMHILGELAAGLAHDFNNLLEVILGFASLTRQHLPPNDPLLESLRMIEESAERAGELVRQMLDLAQEDDSPSRPANPAECVTRVGKIVSRSFDRRIHVESRVESGLPWIAISPSKLEQILLNLCLNARDAMPEGGKLTLEARRERTASSKSFSYPADERVALTIRDTGTGMTPEVMKRAFEPFFSTKNSRRGSGLGLAMVDRILKAHHGSVEIKSALGKGTVVTLRFPLARETNEKEESKRPAAAPEGHGTVLVVDDEPMVLAFVDQGLSSLGYNVLKAENGEAACEIYARRLGEVDFVLLDVVMPEMDGFETFERLHAINPDVKVIFSSGYNSGRLAKQAKVAAPFLGKPFTLEALSQALQKVRHG